MVMATMSFAECSPFPLDESSLVVSVVFVCCVILHIIMNTKKRRFGTFKYLLIISSFICSISSLNGRYFQQRRVRVSFSVVMNRKVSANGFTQQQQQQQQTLFPVLFTSHSISQPLSLLFSSVQTLKENGIFCEFSMKMFGTVARSCCPPLLRDNVSLIPIYIMLIRYYVYVPFL